MDEIVRFIPISTSKSDGNLVHRAVALNNQRNLLPGTASVGSTPRSMHTGKQRKSKKKTKLKRNDEEEGAPTRRKRKKKRKKGRRSSSAEENKQHNLIRSVVHALSPHGTTLASSSRREEVKETPPYTRKFDKNYGADLDQNMIEKAGRRVLQEHSQKNFAIDESGVKRGLLAITGSKRYFLVVNRVGETNASFARGAHGSVFKGWDNALERFVAVKRQSLLRMPLPPSFDFENETRQALLIEKQIRATVRALLPFREMAIMRYIKDCAPRLQDTDNVHTHVMKEGALSILPLVDSFYSPHPDIYYIITPHSDLGDLFHLLDHKKMVCSREGREYPEIVQSLFGDMTSALHYLHSIGVCHGDVKLENFILFWDAQRGRFCARLADFGLSYFSAPGKLTLVTSLTPLYGSPEMLDAAILEANYLGVVEQNKRNSSGDYVVSTPFSATDPGARARVAARMLDVPNVAYPAGSPDVWALGVCLYCLVFETHPFAPDNLVEAEVSSVNFARHIRRKQAQFFSRNGFDHKPCPEMEYELEPLAVLDVVLQDAWSVRPSALEIVQYSPWVREAVVGDYDNEEPSSSLAKKPSDAVPPVEPAPDFSSVDSVSSSPLKSTLSPFAQFMRKGCGTDIAIQFDENYNSECDKKGPKLIG